MALVQNKVDLIDEAKMSVWVSLDLLGQIEMEIWIELVNSRSICKWNVIQH